MMTSGPPSHCITSLWSTERKALHGTLVRRKPGKLDRQAGLRMGRAQPVRPERNGERRFLRAVFPVAEQWKPARGELPARPRIWCVRRARSPDWTSAAAVRRAEDAVVENGLLDIRPGRGHDAAPSARRGRRREGRGASPPAHRGCRRARPDTPFQMSAHAPAPRAAPPPSADRASTITPATAASSRWTVRTQACASPRQSRMRCGIPPGWSVETTPEGLMQDENAVVLIKNLHERLRCGLTRRPAYFASVTSL